MSSFFNLKIIQLFDIWYPDLEVFKKLSRTVKNLRFLPYLSQFQKCWQKTWDSWITDKGLNFFIFFHWLSLPPKFHESDAYLGPGGCSTCSGLESQLKHPEIRKFQSFIRGCKPTHPIFAPEGEVVFILLDSKQTYPLPRREIIIFIFQGCLLCKHPWKGNPDKSWQRLCSENIQKHKRPMETCHPIIILL